MIIKYCVEGFKYSEILRNYQSDSPMFKMVLNQYRTPIKACPACLERINAISKASKNNPELPEEFHV